MPYIARFTSNGVEVSFTGVVSGTDVVDAARVALAGPYADDLAFILVDMSGAERMDAPTAAVRRASQDNRDHLRTHPPFAVAVVAPQAVTFGLARMWQAYVDDTAIRSTVVRTRDDAVRWLAELGIASGVP